MVNTPEDRARAYWRANLKVIGILLSIWGLCGLVLSVVFVEPLNRFRLGGYPLGFWISQQGSIYAFIVLVFVYAKWMERIDDRFGVEDRDR